MPDFRLTRKAGPNASGGRTAVCWDSVSCGAEVRSRSTMFTYVGEIEELRHLLMTIKESYAAYDDWNVSSCLNNLALLYQSREEDYERALLF